MTYNGEHSVLEDEQYSDSKSEHQNGFNFTDEDVFFAKERYKLHQCTPEEGVPADLIKNYFSKKYGF